MAMALCNSNHRSLYLLHFFTIVIILLSAMSIPFSSALSFNFSSFSNDGNITYERAYPENHVIQLTTRTEMVGRATYHKPLRLWDKATGNLADFTTHFSFVIDSQNRTGSGSYGDGLAFFLAPQGAEIPKVTQGASLGLTNDDEFLNSTSNPFVAVEFDIYPNIWDPPYDHVGIDINSMKSRSNLKWLSDIKDGKTNEAWISYDSTTQNLSVAFTGFTNNSTVIQRLDFQVDLKIYLPDLVTFGFSAAAGDASAIHRVYSWEFSSSLETSVEGPIPSPVSNRRRRRNKTNLAVGLGLGGGVFVGALVLIIWLSGFGRKRNDDVEEDHNHGLDEYIDEEFERGTGPKKFSHKELARATNDFNDEQKLGEGGFGWVYKGFLRETNTYIAVKRVSKGSKQGVKEYASEVSIISRLRHKNLVQLLGWCHDKNELLLVYEFMPNGSLDAHLFKEDTLLTWELRYKIAQDSASGLLYLHEEWEQCVVHRDIKSSNIMLDSNFNPKIGDFGLARLVEHSKGSQTTVLAGTMGYMAPECFTVGKASKESDVYSFGIVGLEIACGRKSIDPMAKEGQVYLVQWVWELYGNGKLLEAADPRLYGEFHEQQLQRLLIVGLWCAHPDENLRPSMRQAIHVLKFEAPMPSLPSKMPVPRYFSPAPLKMTGIDDVEGGQSQISSCYSNNTNSSVVTSSSAASSTAPLLNAP